MNERNGKLKSFFEHSVPPGAPLSQVLGFFILGWTASFLYSLIFWVRFSQSYSALFIKNKQGITVRTDSMMPQIDDMLSGTMDAFLLFSFIALLFSVYYYIFYKTDTKSIYLMKRLPKHFELHRRALTLPLLMAAGYLFLAVLTSFLYFILYLLFTPSDALLSGQWEFFGRYLLCLK